MSAERLAISTAEVDDLDTKELFRFVELRAKTLLALHSREEVATRLGLLGRVAPRLVPSVAGLYVFGLLPQSFFPEWGVVCIEVNGTTMRDPIASQENLDGNVGALVEQSLAFVRQRHPGGELSAYVEVEVKEAVVNAVLHRDLRKPSRIAVRLFRDRLEVWSPGGPPEGLADLEELAKDGGISQPRNPIVAACARALGVGDQIGRGLPTIMGTANEAASSEVPRVRATPRDVTVTLPAKWQRASHAHELS